MDTVVLERAGDRRPGENPAEIPAQDPGARRPRARPHAGRGRIRPLLVDHRPLYRKHRRRLCRRQRYPGVAARRRLRRADPGRGQPVCPRRSIADPPRSARFRGRPRSCPRSRRRPPRRRSPGCRRNTCGNRRWSSRPKPVSTAKLAQATFARQDAVRYRDLAMTSYGTRQNAERTSQRTTKRRSRRPKPPAPGSPPPGSS